MKTAPMTTMMNIKIFRISLLAIAVILSLPMQLTAAGSNVNKETAAADSAYNAGEYQKAISAYENIIRNRGASAASLFNLGNAFARSGNLGMARLCYERAKKLSPGDRQIENNLAYVASKIEDANAANAGKDKNTLAPDAPSFFESLYRTLAVEIPSDRWAIIAAVAFAILTGAIAAYIFSSNVTIRKFGFFGSIVFLVLTGIFIALAFMSAKAFERQDEVIITAYKTRLLSSPQPEAKPTSTQLVQGTKLHIDDNDPSGPDTKGWYHVRLNSRTSGWINATECELIKTE